MATNEKDKEQKAAKSEGVRASEAYHDARANATRAALAKEREQKAIEDSAAAAGARKPYQLSGMDRLMIERHNLRQLKQDPEGFKARIASEKAETGRAKPSNMYEQDVVDYQNRQREVHEDSADAFKRIALAAEEGDPAAQELMTGIATMMGADGTKYVSNKLGYIDPQSGQMVFPDWRQFEEQGTRILNVGANVYDFSKKAQSETEKATKEEPKPESTQNAQRQQTSARREAIPSEYDQYRKRIDSIYYKGLPELAQGAMVSAALRGNAGNLKTISDIDISRSSAPLERDYIRARTEYARSGAMARAAGGSPEANEKWSPLDNGDYLVSEKDSGRPLYAMDANGEYMPARFAGNPEAWREFVYNMNTRLGLEQGESYVYTPMGEFVQVVDRKTGKLINVPLKGYMQAIQDSSSSASKSASPNIGSARHMFHAGQGND